MKAEKLLASFKRNMKSRIKDARIDERVHRLKKEHKIRRVWFTVEKEAFRDAVKHLCEISKDPHFSVCSGYDLGEIIVMTYHFTVNYGSDLSEVAVSIRVELPKKTLILPTITDIIPGALISEREMQEMMGVKIKGIPDSRRMFLDEEFPQGVYPWRRDETGPGKLVKNLNKGGRKK